METVSVSRNAKSNLRRENRMSDPKKKKTWGENHTLEAGNLAVVQAFSADTAEPALVDAQASFKGALGPTADDHEPEIS